MLLEEKTPSLLREQKCVPCGFAARGCEGPEIVPVAQSHRIAGRQALEERARGKSVGESVGRGSERPEIEPVAQFQ